MSNKPFVHIANNPQEAIAFQISYETSLTPQERLESNEWLGRQYCISKSIKFPHRIAKTLVIYKDRKLIKKIQ